MTPAPCEPGYVKYPKRGGVCGVGLGRCLGRSAGLPPVLREAGEDLGMLHIL